MTMSFTTCRRVGALAITIALFAVTEPSAFAVTGGGGGGYESEQGPKIFAMRDETLEAARIPFVPEHATTYQRLSFDAGQLHAQRPGADVAGAALAGLDLVATRTEGSDAGKAATLHIAAARAHRNIYTGELSAQVWEYDVRVVDGAAQHPLCDDGPNAALVVPGLWKDGAPSLPDQWFAFACVPVAVADSPPAVKAGHVALQAASHVAVAQRQAWGLPINEIEGPRWPGGAAAKCIDYGYAPWPAGVAALGKPTRTGHTVHASAEAARRFHNLCTRAMTADYQADGHSHTIPGTLVRIFDFTNLPIDLCTGAVIPSACKLIPPSQPSAVSPAVQQAKTVQLSLHQLKTAEIVANNFAALYYESVWATDAAGVARPSCLARLRWQTIDALHQGQIAYAPAGHTADDTDWRYCEDRTVGAFRADDTAPLLFVYSAINEKGLYRFNLGSDAAPRWITTTHVKAGATGIRLGAGFPCSGTACNAVSFEGDLLSPDEPAEIRKAWATSALYLYRNAAGDYAAVVREGTTETPKLPDGYHALMIGSATPAAGSATAPADKSGKPTATAGRTATVGVTGPGFTAVPEGYLFKDPPQLPGASGLEAAAKPGLLHWYKHGAAYCTALAACQSGDGEGHGIGYALLPATPLLAKVPVLIPRPGQGEHPGGPAPEKQTRPAETVDRPRAPAAPTTAPQASPAPH